MLFEEGIRRTSFVDDEHRSSRGISGLKTKRKLSINQITDISSCCSVRITMSFCTVKKGYFIKPGFGSNKHQNHPPATSRKECTYHSSFPLETNKNHDYLQNSMTNGVSATSDTRMMMGADPTRKVHVKQIFGGFRQCFNVSIV